MFLLQKKLFKNKLIMVMIATMYSALPVFPGYSFACASLPLIFLLFYYLYKGKKSYVYLCLFYPIVSDFGATGLFICGLWFVGTILYSVIKRKVNVHLVLGFIFLCIGYVFVNYRLFYMRFYVNEPLNREMFNTSCNSFSSYFFDYLFNGYYHAASLQKFIIIPTVFCVSLLLIILRISKRNSEENIYIKNLMIVLGGVIFFFNIIIALDEIGVVNKILNIVLPPLSGFSFSRLFIFNRLFWYLLFSATLILIYSNKKIRFISPLLGILPYVFSIFTGKLFFQEKITRKKVLRLFLILLGILVVLIM